VGSNPIAHPICYPHANRATKKTVRLRVFLCLNFIVFENSKRKFCLGIRPEDLADVYTIDQKVLKKHRYYLNRLAQFPLDKAEYYQRLKEAHAVNTVRGLPKITEEDWSYTAKILRILALPEQIKDFLRNNKNDPSIVKLFNLRRLLDIVRQGEEQLQLRRFRKLKAEP